MTYNDFFQNLNKSYIVYWGLGAGISYDEND